MKVITFSSIKGGTGKSSLSILTSNYLSKVGYKVLCIDLDIQNSFTFYHFPENTESNKNIFNALITENLKDNIIKDLFISMIPSSFNLVKARSLNPKTLLRLRNQIESDFDYCVIDTAPTFDNLVLNALNFSDIIITPCYLSNFDFKALDFYRNMIGLETDKKDNWKVILNRYRPPKSDNSESELNQYIDLFQNNFNNILESKINETAYIQKAIDTKIQITKAKHKEKLYFSVSNFIKELLNIDAIPEQF
jgi:chromosome partitioning protein